MTRLTHVPKNYFLNFVIRFSRSETEKLTIAPTTAKITVLVISSERMLGAILNKVPDAVLTLREVSVSMTIRNLILNFHLPSVEVHSRPLSLSKGQKDQHQPSFD